MVQRKPSFYLYNIAFIDMALVITSLTVWLLPPAEFGERMSLSLTLLLTAVPLSI